MSPNDPMVCRDHPEARVVALCAECGRPICAECRRLDAEDRAVCVEDAPRVVIVEAEEEEVREEAPAAVPSSYDAEPPQLETVPWESEARKGGDVSAFFQTIRSAILSPMRFMYTIPWERKDYRSPLFFALICGALGYLPFLAVLYFNPPELPPELLGQMREFFGEELSPFKIGLIGLPFLPLILTLGLFMQAGITHLLLHLAGATRRSFEATFRVIAYAQASKLLLFLPGIGQVVQIFYLVFFLLGGVRVGQQAGLFSSFLVLVPLLLGGSTVF